MDVPSPSKFTGSYKKEIESAGKVIYIDEEMFLNLEKNNTLVKGEQKK